MCMCARVFVQVYVCATRDTCILSLVQCIYRRALSCVYVCVLARAREYHSAMVKLCATNLLKVYSNQPGHVSIHYTNTNNNQGIKFSM